jgi:IS1 family transposase
VVERRTFRVPRSIIKLQKRCYTPFSSNTSTPYQGIHYSRGAFDHVVLLSVEGVNRSAIARHCHLSWDTVARWIERACRCTAKFNDKNTRGFELPELQADEIRTFVQTKKRVCWIFTAMEVSSRLWTSTVVGRRSYRNTRTLISDTTRRARAGRPLVTTDGFEFYGRVVRELYGSACIHGKVIKKWRKNGVSKVVRLVVIGSRRQLEEALMKSEDSVKLNTSFIERQNLSIRHGSAYLGRRSLCHAKSKTRLAQHLDLQRCYQNFVRPHSSLKFGSVTRTPAMQAGLAKRALTFREIFLMAIHPRVAVRSVRMSDWLAGRGTPRLAA